MYFINEYNEFKNISEDSTFAEVSKKLVIVEKVMNKLINSVGTTAYEYMTNRDKTFCEECFELKRAASFILEAY